ncbi:GDSL-type esterase/lipase family protein [Butyrivibrio sp. NC2007]|uniref:GDSL-type esterase/lipase family protein n=1 Tax=Butyrivibrio sp. NC2007 TaxID=1280683 RepID=UPI0003B572BD|nr:GDSL-type esterase/lipase family protein [Butyrivibrio sp. NC2007]
MFSINFKLQNNDSLYSQGRGYGFFTPEMAETSSGTAHEQSLKSGGWNTRHFYEAVSDEGRKVQIVKVTVPSFGTYKVSVRISALNKSIEHLTLFSSRRAMIARDVTVPCGSTWEKTYHTAVTPFIPALSATRCNDKDIFISYTGSDVSPENVSLDVTITEESVPVIWIGGDSTVTDQNAGIPYFPFGSFSGWAQTLPRFIEGAAVCNMSHSGLTSNCFRDDGHYDIIRELIKPGDCLIMQFGHNDQKRRNLAAFGGYADNLRRYVKETRQAGAEAILCSPISRVPLELSKEDAQALNMDRHYSLLADHAKATEAVAKELDVPFIDLHGLTFEKWLEFGDSAKDFFMPGDVTHTNEYGSVMIADIFMKTLRSLDKGKDTLPGRCDNGLTCSFWSPDSDTKVIPAQEPEPDIFSIALPYLDIAGFEDKEGLEKAFRYCLLDPCVMFLHPDAPLPRAQLLMVLFKALRIAGTRPYRGKYSDLNIDEWDSGYVETMISENLIDPATTKSEGDKLFFRPNESLTYEELDSFLMRFYESDKAKRDIPLEECVRRAMELGIDERKEAAPGKWISRGEVYTALARFIDLEEDIKTRSINFEA